jgi:hypothetical protein
MKKFKLVALAAGAVVSMVNAASAEGPYYGPAPSRVTHVVRPLLDQQEALSHRLTAVERPTLPKIGKNTHSLRFFRGAPSDTPSLDACV